MYHSANERSSNAYTWVLFLPVKITITVTISVDTYAPMRHRKLGNERERVQDWLKLLQISYFKIHYAVIIVLLFFIAELLYISMNLSIVDGLKKSHRCAFYIWTLSYLNLRECHSICSPTVNSLICFIILIHFQM